jgi:hypothetical protein
MFTGFASENTPAIQVWDFGTFPSPPTSTVSLVDDCAPIQLFKTGAQVAAIFVYLPTAPVEGKQLKIVNIMRGVNGTPINLFSSDRMGNGSATPILIIGAGQSVDLCYSKDFITRGVGGATSETGWISLNFAPPSSANYSSAVLGGENNKVTSTYAAVAGGSSNTASGSNAAVVGGGSSTASGSNSAVVGGFNNTASGLRSAAIGGTTNQATQQYAATIGGDTIRATGSYAFAGGGSVNNSQGQFSAVVGGNSNTGNGTSAGIFAGENNNTNGSQAVVCGGSYNTANGNSSFVLGGTRGTTRLLNCYAVFPASNSPITAVLGVSQSAMLVLGRQTTDATATVLTSNTNAATTTNQVILPNNSAYYFRGEVIAGVTGAGDTKGWYVEGVIKRGASAASTALVGTPTATSLYADTGAATWSIAVTADTTNGGLAITVTGAAATTIRWVAQIRTTEMTY